MGLWCGCGGLWPPRKLPARERRTCARVQGGLCSLTEPCPACLLSRSRAVHRVGWEFPAWGVRTQQAIVENA